MGGRAVVCPPIPPPVFLVPPMVINPTEKQCVDYLAVVSTRTRVVSPLHLLATCVYQMLWRASMASPSLTCYPSLSFFFTPYPCYSKMSKLTSVLRYVALLCLRLRLSSALHLHLCRLPPFRYYSPHPYSKMFVGGLSWDTTDGTFFPFPHTHVLYPFLQCHVHFANFAELCVARV
jgi:hypothetical protein